MFSPDGCNGLFEHMYNRRSRCRVQHGVDEHRIAELALGGEDAVVLAAQEAHT